MLESPRSDGNLLSNVKYTNELVSLLVFDSRLHRCRSKPETWENRVGTWDQKNVELTSEYDISLDLIPA